MYDQTARLVVGRRHEVLAVNPPARRLIDDSPHLSLRDGVLAAGDRGAAAQMSSLSREAASRGSAVTLFGPILARAERLGEDGESPLALTLRKVSDGVSLECADLEPVFGVTRSEQQALLLLLQGLSSQDIAAQLNKSILTIRTHIKRVYAKLGVKTREQLFAYLMPYIFIS